MANNPGNVEKNFVAFRKEFEKEGLDDYVEMIDSLADDTACEYHVEDKQTGVVNYYPLLGLKRAPAAKGHHHAYEGGLVQHMLEMIELWQACRNVFHWHQELPVDWKDRLTYNKVLRGIFHHDLHKAYRTFYLKSEDPWQVEYARGDKTMVLMTNDIKSMWILNQHEIRLDEEMTNALIWSEGGWAKIKSQCYGVLGVMIASLDAISGSCLAKMAKGEYLDEDSIPLGHSK